MPRNVAGSAPLTARTGRSKQRYDGETRLLAGCIPIRTSAEGEVQVLMISRLRGDGLIFPKARARRLAAWLPASSPPRTVGRGGEV